MEKVEAFSRHIFLPLAISYYPLAIPSFVDILLRVLQHLAATAAAIDNLKPLAKILILPRVSFYRITI
ncbi:hypothetical protein NIES2130_20665 [Scytonema sp. HK-05]|nr:hypothetical protein NIES2130_20665 [Scytonema sp. HK-05]